MVNADEAVMVNADGEGVACFDVVGGGTAGTAKGEPLPPMPADSFEGQAASVLPNHPTQFGTDHHALQVRIITKRHLLLAYYSRTSIQENISRDFSLESNYGVRKSNFCWLA